MIVLTEENQTTIKKDISLKGVGLHTGKEVNLTFKPAAANSGYTFTRIDLKGKPLIGNIAVSLTLGLSFLFCGSAHGNVVPMWIPMILAFGLTLIRELVKLSLIHI